MVEMTVSEVDQFLTRYRLAFPEQGKVVTNDFQSAFTHFKEGYLQVKQAAGVRALTKAPGFNIFHLLGIDRLETKTHSVLLAELLHPQGSHGQGELFLQAFLNHCHFKYPDFPKPSYEIGTTRWSVSTEMTFQYGRMDIIMLNPLLGYLCLIENKVDAYEQDHQLERYWQWMYDHRQEYPNQALIFLTPHGGPAGTAWGHSYFRLSYRKDIVTWLDATLPNIQAPGVREVVRQYLIITERL